MARYGTAPMLTSVEINDNLKTQYVVVIRSSGMLKKWLIAHSPIGHPIIIKTTGKNVWINSAVLNHLLVSSWSPRPMDNAKNREHAAEARLLKKIINVINEPMTAIKP